MKAIVNVNQKSAYKIFNGLTFEVLEVTHHTLSLRINGHSVDFTFKEVIIVDFQKVMQEASDDYQWLKSRTMYLKLKDYQKVNGIEYTPTDLRIV